MLQRFAFITFGALALISSGTAHASICMDAAVKAAKIVRAPARIVQALVLTESSGQPWTLNVAGRDFVYRSRSDAEAALAAFRAAGAAPDVGCWQVSLKYHADLLPPGQEFDPWKNTVAGISYLLEMRRETGSWGRAVAAYHSRTPAYGDAYACRVLKKLQPKANCNTKPERKKTP